MTRTRALLLALAIEASPGCDPRPVRFRKHKTAYVATLLVRPEEYRLLGLVDTGLGMDLLWQETGSPKLEFY